MLTRREFVGGGALTAVAAEKPRPNILFLFPDQWRFDWTGLNQKLGLKTPNLNALAGRGVTFTRAVVASPLCAPSRACLASGREYDRCGVPSNSGNYPLAQTTFYKLLRDSGGYHVMGVGKFDLNKGEHEAGIDGRKLISEWGFSDAINNHGKGDAVASGAKEAHDPYMAYLHGRGLATAHVADFRKRRGDGAYAGTFPTPLPDDAYCDNWLAQNGLDLLKASPKGKPWFMQVNFTGPHPPMDITARMEKLVRRRDFPQPDRNTQHSPETHAAIRQNYAAMIENIDRWVGLYLDELKRRGEIANTLVVFSSDHGEMLGDHNRWGKHVPFQPSAGVPLIAAGPGVARDHRSDALVSVMDLAATYLDYANVARPAEMDAKSIRAVMERRAATHRKHVLSGLEKWRMVWDGRHKLVRGFEEQPLLFDLREDPMENDSIAGRSPEMVQRLARLLPGASAHGA